MSETSEPEVDVEKYKLLFDYFKNQYEIAMQSYHKLEDKATKYVTLLTILITAYSLIAKTVFIDSKIMCNWYYIILYGLLIFTLLAIGSAWRFIFNCISLNDVGRMPNKQDTIDWFHDNERAGIYLGLVERYKESITIYENLNKHRTDNLNKAFDEIKFSGIAFGVSLLYLLILKLFF